MAPLFCRNEGQRRTWGTAFKQCSIRIHRLVFVWQTVSICFFYIVWLVVSQVSHIRPCTFPRVWGIENKSQRHHFLHGFLQPSKFQATPEDADRQDPKRQRALVVKCRVSILCRWVDVPDIPRWYFAKPSQLESVVCNSNVVKDLLGMNRSDSRVCVPEMVPKPRLERFFKLPSLWKESKRNAAANQNQSQRCQKHHESWEYENLEPAKIFQNIQKHLNASEIAFCMFISQEIIAWTANWRSRVVQDMNRKQR